MPDPETMLWRRIHPMWVKQSGDGTFSVTSQAFQNLPGYDAFSVHDSKIASSEGMTPESVLADFPEYSMVQFSTKIALESGQTVDPCPEDNDPSHTHVTGNKSKSVKKKFKNGCEWLVLPQN